MNGSYCTKYFILDTLSNMYVEHEHYSMERYVLI